MEDTEEKLRETEEKRDLSGPYLRAFWGRERYEKPSSIIKYTVERFNNGTGCHLLDRHEKLFQRRAKQEWDFADVDVDFRA